MPRGKPKAGLAVNRKTYTPQVLVNKLAMATLEGNGMGLRKSPFLKDVSEGDKQLFQRIVGISVDEFNQRLGSKLDQLADRIVDRMLETVDDTPLQSLGFNLSVAIDKRQRLAQMGAAANANVNIQVNNYGQLSKEEILAKLMGKPVAAAIEKASSGKVVSEPLEVEARPTSQE
jgi:hypothetical protein